MPGIAPAILDTLFHTPGPGPYLLTHSVGCLPRASLTALSEKFLRPWAEQGANAWAGWLEQITEFRSELAALFGGTPAEYCPQSNLSSALTKVLSALHAGTSRRSDKAVLIAGEDSFPSMGYVLQQQQRYGYTLRLIPSSKSPARLETWADALTADVRAVLVTHVHSNTGEVAPIEAIARLCTERNVLCILDVAQSAGIVPCRFAEVGASIVIGSCVKWLCGGPGAGFLWMRPDLIDQLEPSDVGWFSHANPFEFDIHHFEYAPDARRFWGGTPSIAPFAVAAASLDLVRRIGVDAIWAHNRSLIEVFRNAVSDPWRERLPSGPMGGTLCIPTGLGFDQQFRELVSAGIQFDHRKDVLRLSFHLCNTVSDAERAARAWMGTR